jgi:hypothetical protein
MLVAALAACSESPVESCGETALTPGRWRYSAVQESPVRATMEGTLQISTVQCGDFTGSLDVLVTDAQGQQRRVAGPLTGRAVNGTALRFDVDVEMTTRQHVGMLSADSVNGNWLVVAGSATVSGTFRSRKENGS